MFVYFFELGQLIIEKKEIPVRGHRLRTWLIPRKSTCGSRPGFVEFVWDFTLLFAILIPSANTEKQISVKTRLDENSTYNSVNVLI